MSRAEPLIRQWNLLKSLQAFHYGQTAEELAQRLECSKRQVQRDLGVLQLVGFPVFHETRDGGKRYWRMESRALEHGGLTLSTTEMLSLYLSQQLLTPLAGTQFGDGLSTLLEKIKALLPKKALGYFLDESNLLVKSLPRHDYSGQDKEITILNHAIHEGRVLNVRYQSASKGKPSDATFHPYGLVFLHGSLYCIGHMVEYDEIRTLKVSRFLGVQMTNKTFQRPASFSLRQGPDHPRQVHRLGRHQHPRVAVACQPEDCQGRRRVRDRRVQALRHHGIQALAAGFWPLRPGAATQGSGCRCGAGIDPGPRRISLIGAS